MLNTNKTILELTSDEAMAYMMEDEQYCTFELPEYMKFGDVLKQTATTIGNRDYSDCVESDATLSDNVNLTMLTNKDGGYGVRPLTLTNPYMYYFLVRELFGTKNWDDIKKHFEECKVENIDSYAMPVVKDDLMPEPFRNSTTILNWWRNMEQRSIELSLQYRYMFVSDITNCYGSINHESIIWALTRKATAKENENTAQIGANIKRLLHDMGHGSTIGIPQGSVIYDMIAEIVLAYADLLLSEKIAKEHPEIKEYTILRYRDDYKVFSNSRGELEVISYALQQILEGLNFRMNTAKTKISSSIITDSIKPDKLNYIINTPICGKNYHSDTGMWYAFGGLQKHLLYILLFARQNPNSGQIKTMLSLLSKRIENRMKDAKKRNGKKGEADDSIATLGESLLKKKRIKETAWQLIAPHGIEGSIRAHCAIAMQIGLENVGAVHYALKVISRLLEALDDKEEREDIARLVSERLRSMPNSDYTQLWLQQLTIESDEQNGGNPYSSPLSQFVYDRCRGERSSIWNNDWLKKEIAEECQIKEIVDEEKRKEVGRIIEFKEKRNYNEWWEDDEQLDEFLAALEKLEASTPSDEELMKKAAAMDKAEEKRDEKMKRLAAAMDKAEEKRDEEMMKAAAVLDRAEKKRDEELMKFAEEMDTLEQEVGQTIEDLLIDGDAKNDVESQQK